MFLIPMVDTAPSPDVVSQVTPIDIDIDKDIDIDTFKRTWCSGMQHGVIWYTGTHVSINLLPTSLGQILLP